MFMPKGIVGLPAQILAILSKIRRKKESIESPPSVPEPEAIDP
jgi:hypothetical protein